MNLDEVHLQNKGGVDIPHDGVTENFVKSGADIYVVSGKGSGKETENNITCLFVQ